jgi:hypothetical protein
MNRCGFVEFDSEEGANRALRVRAIVGGQELYVDSALNSRSSGASVPKSLSSAEKAKYVYKREQSSLEQTAQTSQEKYKEFRTQSTEGIRTSLITSLSPSSGINQLIILRLHCLLLSFHYYFITYL